MVGRKTSTRIVHRCVRTKYEEVVISKENKDIFGKIKFDIWLRYQSEFATCYIYLRNIRNILIVWATWGQDIVEKLLKQWL